jgi:streptogramin lyase
MAFSQESFALTGLVSSKQEGAMEGVLVTARKNGATIATTVVTDAEGRYSFPKDRLEPGQYGLTIKAVGYDQPAPVTVTVGADRAATSNIQLQKTRDLAAQLSNAEWLMSMPGTDADKAKLRVTCVHCHTYERIVRSTHTAEEWVDVVKRMLSYTVNSSPFHIQQLPHERLRGMVSPEGEKSATEDSEKQRADLENFGKFLASINLSAHKTWPYELKTLPRPKGKATRVIYTGYDLPARTREPHDVIVDSQGMVWYDSFGEEVLGKLDPKTGKTTEYTIPTLQPGEPTGTLAIRFDKEENIWLGMMYQAGIGKFDRKTEKFQTWSLPKEFVGPYVQINQVAPGGYEVDKKVWLEDSGARCAYRLDTTTGKFEQFVLHAAPAPFIYDVSADSKNNGYVTVIGAGAIARIDATTGKIQFSKTPTPKSGPRRGMMDPLDRFWFGENFADKIGMLDTKTDTFKEWSVPTPGAWPYDTMIDRWGDVWTGGEYDDRILRLNPETGEMIQYLLPSKTNVRRVYVQNSGPKPIFWVGDNDGASIIKLEPR